jgi:glucose/arabinose dehydrogenase
MRRNRPAGRPRQTVVAATLAIAAAVVVGCGLPILGLRPALNRSKSTTSPDTTTRQGNLAHIAVALKPFAAGLVHPVQLTSARDASGRVYIPEQAGLVLVADANGRVHSQPFLDIRSLVLSGGERGVLGLAFHPDYKMNGLFFISYTNVNGETVLARYHVSSDPLRADPASAKRILLIHQLGGEHKSGQLFFGPDRYLYMSVGDGGLGSPRVNGQRKDTLLGKILRLDVDHTSEGREYAIPPDNPFVGDPHARGEIWAYGLRNPWRFSFDRATGDLYLGDVGDFSSEEIDMQRAGHGGENYGWAVYEGDKCEQANCSLPHMTRPIVTYVHARGLCAVMGGYVYRGTRSPSLYGIYLYADYCSGRIFGLVAADARPGQPSTTRQLFDLNTSISSFGEDEAGELYVVGYMSGTIYHLTAAAGIPA